MTSRRPLSRQGTFSSQYQDAVEKQKRLSLGERTPLDIATSHLSQGVSHVSTSDGGKRSVETGRVMRLGVVHCPYYEQIACCRR